MMTTNENDFNGKKLLSIDMGIGTITGMEQIGDKDKYFYIVDYGKKNAKYFSSTEENKKTRFISTKEEFANDLKNLKPAKKQVEFQSKKERIDFFKASLLNCNLNQVIKNISLIGSLNDLAPNEKEIQKKLIKSLEEEASLLFDYTAKESTQYISKYL